MWFAVPTARAAARSSENAGQADHRTVDPGGYATSYAAAGDPGTGRGRSWREAVSVFGKVVLIFLKLIAGLIVSASSWAPAH